MDQKVKELFSSQPMASFRNGRKLSSYLVRAKLYLLERRVGSHKWRCNCCHVCRSIKKMTCLYVTTTKDLEKSATALAVNL